MDMRILKYIIYNNICISIYINKYKRIDIKVSFN